MAGACVIVSILLVLGAVGAAMNSLRCTICGNQLKRKYYTWKLDGKRHRLCPHCNSSVERHQSTAAMRQFRGQPPVGGGIQHFAASLAARRNPGGRNALVLLLVLVGAGVFLMRRGETEARDGTYGAAALRSDGVPGAARPGAPSALEREDPPDPRSAREGAPAAVAATPALPDWHATLSPDERHALDEAKRTAALIDAREACMSRLRQTREYRQLASALSTLDARVKALRRSDPKGELAAASRRRLEAQTQLARLERSALERDPAVRAAEAAHRGER
jgi:hypothetical protein